MKNDKISIRWHSRAGQGAVTASQFLARVAVKLGFRAESFPDFGAEKRGASVVVFNRISKKNERLDDPAHLKTPEIVILMDLTLVDADISAESIVSGMTKFSILLTNSKKFNAKRLQNSFDGEIFCVDGTGIAVDTLGKNLPNIPIIGALTKILEIDKIKFREILKSDLESIFPEKIAQKNLAGFDRGWNEVSKMVGRAGVEPATKAL